MPVVAITGHIASGKSTVLEILKAKKVPVFDADKIVHRLYQNKASRVYKAIAKRYPEVLTQQKNISRVQLERVIFHDQKKLTALESIVHPEVIRVLKNWIKTVNKKKVLAAAEVPLLFEKQLDVLFDEVIVVKASMRCSIIRIQKKFGIDRTSARKKFLFARENRKNGYQVKYSIINNSTITELKKRVHDIWSLLLKEYCKETK